LTPLLRPLPANQQNLTATLAPSQPSFSDSETPRVIATPSLASPQKWPAQPASVPRAIGCTPPRRLPTSAPSGRAQNAIRRPASALPRAVQRASHPRSFANVIHLSQKYTISRNNTLPVKTPIWPDRKSPTCGRKKIHRKVPCTSSTANTSSHTAILSSPHSFRLGHRPANRGVPSQTVPRTSAPSPL